MLADLQRSGKPGRSPRVVVTGGEPILQGKEELIRGTWGCDPRPFTRIERVIGGQEELLWFLNERGDIGPDPETGKYRLIRHA
jgi:hypothetical protein